MVDPLPDETLKKEKVYRVWFSFSDKADAHVGDYDDYGPALTACEIYKERNSNSTGHIDEVEKGSPFIDSMLSKESGPSI